MAMQLTRAGEYAVRSLVYLAAQGPDARVMASEVATAQQIPVNFVRKILESLAKTGLVKSYRGAGGGFTLGREAGTISLCQIVEAIEGPFAFNECLTVNSCNNKAHCPITMVWQEAQTAVQDILSRHSLADIIRSVPQKLTALN